MNSKALVIAKKDFADAARSKLLWGTVLVLLVVTIPNYLSQNTGGLLDTSEEAVRFIPMVFENYVAPIVMIAAYKSVVGERESGSLRVLFGLPTTRRDFVLGKAMGRAAVVAVILLTATLVIGAIAAAIHGTLPFLLFVGIAGYVALYGIVWTGVTVGISAAVSSRVKAITAVLGLFLFFGPFQLWRSLAVPAFARIFTGSASTAGIDPLRWSTWPTWYKYVQRLNPIENFGLGRYYAIDLLNASVSTNSRHVLNLFGIAVLVAWFVVPLLIGYWRFERADLG